MSAFGSPARAAASRPLRPVPVRNLTVARSRSDARGPAERGDAASLVGDVLAAPGQALTPSTRAAFEPAFGYDFSTVRVHTDERAAHSARSIGALSYAAGTHIAFDSGRYAPGTPAGDRLLAHELTHVAQQSHASPEREAEQPASGLRGREMTVAPVEGAAEREASSVAHTVASGGVLARPVGAPGGMIQRSIGGIIGGITAGVVLGAAALAAAEVLLSSKRGLTGPERKEAQKVFGKSLDYDKVRIAESAVMGSFDNARTPFNTIYFPPGTQKTYGFANFMPWLIHEMCHTWQTQHGIGVVTKVLTALGGSKAYKYGDLKKQQAAGKHFLDFNTEQQADICRGYYVALQSGLDTSAFEFYIQEVRNDGQAILRRNEEPNDGVMPEGPTRMA